MEFLPSPAKILTLTLALSIMPAVVLTDPFNSVVVYEWALQSHQVDGRKSTSN